MFLLVAQTTLSISALFAHESGFLKAFTTPCPCPWQEIRVDTLLSQMKYCLLYKLFSNLSLNILLPLHDYFMGVEFQTYQILKTVDFAEIEIYFPIKHNI